MLRLPPFEFRAARTAAEAVEFWGDSDGRAMYVAGGTDLIPNMKRRQFEPPVLIGIRRMENGRDVEVAADGSLSIGAGATLRVRGNNGAFSCTWDAASRQGEEGEESFESAGACVDEGSGEVFSWSGSASSS